MASGELDRRIRVEKSQTVRDEMGGEGEGAWGTHCTIWAKRSDSSDGEAFKAGEIAATRVTRWKVRSSSATRAITPAGFRIHADGDFYEITGIKETRDGRNNYLEITSVVRNDAEGSNL